jgi:protein TonB
MTTRCPVAPQLLLRAQHESTVRPVAAAGSWRYESRPRSRRIMTIAVVISASLHAAVFFGARRTTPKPVAPRTEEFVIRLTTMPEVKELEEPEQTPNDDAAPIDTATLVPMQQDLPQVPKPADFVQQINFATLLEQPDFSQLKVYAIPEHIRAGGSSLAEKIGKIFNPEDLDRVPEPIFQPAPPYPHDMKREGVGATVTVEFIVDTKGMVLSPTISESTHHSFDEAALAGVARWKFRAGLRAGKKVNTRMRVPVIFKLSEPEI